MAKTLTEIRENVAIKLADESDIEAFEHREIENDILDYIEALEGSIPKFKVLMLDSFTTDRNYSVATGLVSSKVINTVSVLLVCKAANNGFAVGDIVNPPSPYVNGGIGVQFRLEDPTAVKVMTNDEIWIMTAYNATSGAPANNLMIKGGSSANWSIKLIIGYI